MHSSKAWAQRPNVQIKMREEAQALYVENGRLK